MLFKSTLIIVQQIINKGKQTLYPKSDVLNFKLLDENRKEILNLITPEKFLNL